MPLNSFEPWNSTRAPPQHPFPFKYDQWETDVAKTVPKPKRNGRRRRRRSSFRQRDNSVSSSGGHRERRNSQQSGYHSSHNTGQHIGQYSGQHVGHHSGQYSGHGGQHGGQHDGQQYGGHYSGHHSGQNSGQHSGQHSGQPSGQHNSQQGGQYSGYRSRTNTNTSVGNQSIVSVKTNDSNRGLNNGYRNNSKRYNYQKKTLRWDRDRLSREIYNFYEEHRQPQELRNRKDHLKEALHKILSTAFPEYEVNPFIVGSTANGMANNKSDVDICLVMTDINKKVDSISAEVENKLKTTNEETDEKTGVLINVDDNLTAVLEPSEDKPKDSNKDTEDVDKEDAGKDMDDPSVSSINEKDPSVPMLKRVETVLNGCHFATKLQIIFAKVPILKFVDKISGIEVTINVNKLVSIRNTHLIHDYTKLDWRVQPLVMVIKAWAKDHGINDAYNKSISSYSLVLMVIHYLQYACNPPVLPCLQELDPLKYNPTSDVLSLRFDQRPRRWLSRNESSLKELLIGFLDYYSYSFCYSKDAISVRTGKTLPKHVAQRYISEDNWKSQWKFLSIEEPFNRSNTARSVFDEVTFERILSVFRVSHYTLRRYPMLDSIMTGKYFTNDYTESSINAYITDKSPKLDTKTETTSDN